MCAHLGMLLGAISSGFLMAIMMSNAGGAWDNAKKWVLRGSCSIAVPMCVSTVMLCICVMDLHLIICSTCTYSSVYISFCLRQFLSISIHRNQLYLSPFFMTPFSQVEKGFLGEGKGKHTKYHVAVVVGDTVGDPFKDTSGR